MLTNIDKCKEERDNEDYNIFRDFFLVEENLKPFFLSSIMYNRCAQSKNEI